MISGAQVVMSFPRPLNPSLVYTMFCCSWQWSGTGEWFKSRVDSTLATTTILRPAPPTPIITMPRPRQTTLTTNTTALNTLPVPLPPVPVPIPNVWSKSGSPIDETRREDAFIKSLKATEINARLRGRFVDATALKNIATLSRFIPYSSIKQIEEETRERERLKRLLVVSIARSESMNQVDVAMRFLRGVNAEPLTRGECVGGAGGGRGGEGTVHGLFNTFKPHSSIPSIRRIPSRNSRRQ